jgi:hypothetical protein
MWADGSCSTSHSTAESSNWKCTVAGATTGHPLGEGVDLALTYHPKARRGDPIVAVASDLRCLLEQS